MLCAKTSNQAIWGDTDGVPLSLTLVKQVLEYFSKVTNDISSDSIDHNAMKEQQALNIPWYTNFLELWNREEVHDETAIPTSEKRHSQAIQEKLQNRFIEIWNSERLSNRKLRFHNTIKDKFSQENYLQLTQKPNQGRAADLAKHRMPKHKLNVEVGRNETKPKMRVRKSCMMTAVMKK